MKHVFIVEVPEDSGIDGAYSTAAKAIKRLMEYGPVPPDSVGALRGGKTIYVLPTEGHEYPQTHAWRCPIL